MKVGRDYAWWVSYSWTYEWLEEVPTLRHLICDNIIGVVNKIKNNEV